VTTAERPPTVSAPPALPRIYIASPLTNLNDDQRRGLSCELKVVKIGIERLTVGDRIENDAWPVTVYAPFDHTAPWRNDGLGAGQVYERNLSELLDSDALIVLADRAASAGVGQEIEWAARIGLPILYLSSATTVSRQIQGTPAAITCVAYDGDSETLAAQVTNFLRQWRNRIQDGPRHRASRRLRFEPLTSRLRQAWEGATDRTGVAARCNLDVNLIQMTLVDPGRVAMLPVDAVTLLCAEFGVTLTRATSQLSVPATRALVLAADEEGWPDTAVEKLRLHGMAASALDPQLDLRTLDSWRQLYMQLPPG